MLYKEIFIFERKGTESFVRLETNKEVNIIKYQINMIKENKINGILPVNLISFNDTNTLCYEITSKIPFERYENIYNNEEKILEIIKSICEIIQNSYKFYLNENGFLIDKDFIFIHPQMPKAYLIYLPFKTQLNSNKSLREMIIQLSNNNYLKIQKLCNEIISAERINYGDIINMINSLLINSKSEDINDKDRINYEKSEEGVNEKNNAITIKGLIKKIFNRRDKADFIQDLLNNKNNIDTNILNDNINNSFKEAYFCVAESYDENKYENTTLLDSKAEVYLEIDNLKHKITKNNFLIGRMKENTDLCIDNKLVGRIHSEIVRKDGNFYIIDFNSKNGTVLNGNKISSGKEYLLKHDDIIFFADTKCKFKFY